MGPLRMSVRNERQKVLTGKVAKRGGKIPQEKRDGPENWQLNVTRGGLQRKRARIKKWVRSGDENIGIITPGLRIKSSEKWSQNRVSENVLGGPCLTGTRWWEPVVTKISKEDGLDVRVWTETTKMVTSLKNIQKLRKRIEVPRDKPPQTDKEGKKESREWMSRKRSKKMITKQKKGQQWPIRSKN